MNLYKLIEQEERHYLKPILLVTILTGLTSVLAIELIHTAAENIANKELSQNFLILFILTVGIFLYGKKYVLDQSSELFEWLVNRVRHRIADKIRRLELATLESVGLPSIYARITQDALDISSMSVGVSFNIQGFFLLIFMLFYIAYLSFWAFVLVTIGIILSVWSYARNAKKLESNWKKQSLKEKQFFEQFNHILNGFKELKINRNKQKGVLESYTKINKERESIRIANLKLYNGNLLYAQAFFYIVVAAIIFVLPLFHEQHSVIIIKIIATILFMIGPLEALLIAIPNFAAMENAAHHIIVLEKHLDQQLQRQQEFSKGHQLEENVLPLPFEESICLKGLVYKYEHADPAHAFSIGPMDLTIKKGEIIFITGGNGSGKSTFLKMFTGLYQPKKGSIYLDRDIENGEQGTLVHAHNYQEYRNLFTLIFTDFHLFDQLYGLEDVDEAIVNDLLLSMELSQEKTVYRNGAFSNIKLSSGQKKRLALVTSIIENKEIYIFDEVASDLDPGFRDTYYYKIIPMLKAQNKTVFVVSHDKEYWEVGDRVLELKNGKFYEREQLCKT